KCGFHQASSISLIDTRSIIYYALTIYARIVVLFISNNFGRSAEVSTAENGEVKITATIDGHSITVTEGSLRRHLKLDDQDGLGLEVDLKRLKKPTVLIFLDIFSGVKFFQITREELLMKKFKIKQVTEMNFFIQEWTPTEVHLDKKALRLPEMMKLPVSDEERKTKSFGEDKISKKIDWNDPTVIRKRTGETKVGRRCGWKDSKDFWIIIPRDEVPIGDGSSKNYKVLSEMLEDFDRQDVEELYRLVKEKYSASRLEGFDLMLWGDLLYPILNEEYPLSPDAEVEECLKESSAKEED
ncbi:hypothetical protein Tco_1007463, partial [Tanacetum coccineum]